jgi:signal transduction histidine kinase
VPKSDEQDELPTETRDNPRIDELAGLSTQLLTIMEGERAQLAKKLHDELGGMITAAKMDMQWLSAHIGSTLDAKGLEKFNSVVQMLDQAMVLKRRVVENLRPSLLDHFGLSVAMRSHFDEHCKQAGIECMASLPDESLAMDPALQLTLFRVAQEVLNGIIGRGGSGNVEVVIEPHEQAGQDGYLMTIGDDGATLDETAGSLRVARHRVALAGGRLELESRDGHGNQVRVFVPRSAAGSA